MPNAVNRIDLNLDTITREAEFEPFVFVVGDREITLGDPAELDYQDLLECETPLQFIRYTATEEDRDFLAKQRIPGWKLGRLLEEYLKHYKAEERVDARKKLGF